MTLLKNLTPAPHNWFWPVHTGASLFDFWSLIHLAFWFIIGSQVAAMMKAKGWKALPLVISVGLIVAYGWEIFERHAERLWPLVWNSPESWVNSWISDPLMCVLGLAIGWWGYLKWRPK